MKLNTLKNLLPIIFFFLGYFFAKSFDKSIEINESKLIEVPAVAIADGGGVLTKIQITAKPGKGHIYLDIKPFSEPTTQQSFYNAVKAAYFVTKSNKKYDFTISVKANTSLIGGPSAGLAVALGVSALLLDKKLKNCVATGVVDSYGNVYPVGGIIEKAKAVMQKYNCFIIPWQNRYYTVYLYKEKCHTILGIKTCTMVLEPKQIDLVQYFKQFNFTIIPVKNLREAINYAIE
ncbi:NEQ414 [Nanoarchaeum equitans Kin4-M]|uniref:NEQ414 n=1 Tax=Nanoarchaeum equitans (strain Kin4-M) TaxID=228908 RepID=Q74N33_NANEQ|nr:NEQ414 [Nanoarchaeum equitans Kin4-M]